MTLRLKHFHVNKKMLLIEMFASVGSGLMAPLNIDPNGFRSPDEYYKAV